MTDADQLHEFACDLCGESDAVELPHVREFTADQPIHVCTRCGFVYVKERRSAERIAATWSEQIFGDGYTAAVPGVAGRLAYVAEFIEQTVGLRDTRLAEIGAGEGFFLDLARDRYGATVFGVEPSPANCASMRSRGIDCFEGTIEQLAADESAPRTSFDLVAVLWTLENCQDLKTLLRGARDLLAQDGHLVVATGSRILVPFKKPLWAYLSTNPADTHAFRFSALTLQGALAVSGFATEHLNRYLDSDVLCAIGKQADGDVTWEHDRYLDVYSFFERWYVDTTVYFPAAE